MLDPSGLITEASNSNVFFVREGRLLTPSQVAANLKGTTKATVVRLCQEAGIDFSETELGLADVLAAEECFITSATREIMPVRRVDCGGGQQREFPDGGGQLTRALAGAYKDFVSRYVARHQHYSMFG
jgi:branched-subunit amino acid aminotransferase/4-amino-4-deoxychorismate lyase